MRGRADSTPHRLKRLAFLIHLQFRHTLNRVAGPVRGSGSGIGTPEKCSDRGQIRNLPLNRPAVWRSAYPTATLSLRLVRSTLRDLSTSTSGSIISGASAETANPQRRLDASPIPSNHPWHHDSTGVAVDLDVLDPAHFRPLLFNKPGVAEDTFAGIPQGRMRLE